VDGPPVTVRLLVVIVNYRLADYIERLLRRCPFDADVRVLLVDNDSQPDEIRRIAEAFGADLLLLDRNYGFAGAVNRAMASVPSHREILLLNPDVSLTPAALARLRQLRAERGLTGITPLLRDSDGTIQVGTAGGSAGVGAFAAYFLFLSHLFPRLGGVFYTRRQLRSALAPAWLCMACLLLDGAAFERFGPVPEKELAYAEDVAWGLAASRMGARFAVATDVAVTHEQGAAGGAALWRDAVARLAVMENGRWAGGLAVACMTAGLWLRGVIRR
jgi:N-acetylglucosaminyl-diphospho-decaprenol L-rhamnosyltransferase